MITSDHTRPFTDSSSLKETAEKIISISRDKTVADQWQAQNLARILVKNKVIMVSDIRSKKLIEDMHMIYAISLSLIKCVKDVFMFPKSKPLLRM